MFIHKSGIQKGPPSLAEGESVRFNIMAGPQGKRDEAKNLTGPKGRPVLGSQRMYSQPWIICPCSYWMSNGMRGFRGGMKQVGPALAFPHNSGGYWGGGDRLRAGRSAGRNRRGLAQRASQTDHC